MDYKQSSSVYQDFGNFNYGAVGTAVGFPDSVLLREAGRAHRNRTIDKMNITLRTLVFTGAVYVVLAGCSEPQCENVILREITSPDGQRVATLFARNCDATTPYVQAVMVREKGSNFSGVDPASYVFTMRGQHKVSIQWLANDHLLVNRPQNSDDIFNEMKVWKGSKISYKSE